MTTVAFKSLVAESDRRQIVTCPLIHLVPSTACPSYFICA